jgi:hypothetical protein
MAASLLPQQPDRGRLVEWDGWLALDQHAANPKGRADAPRHEDAAADPHQHDKFST